VVSMSTDSLSQENLFFWSLRELCQSPRKVNVTEPFGVTHVVAPKCRPVSRLVVISVSAAFKVAQEASASVPQRLKAPYTMGLFAKPKAASTLLRRSKRSSTTSRLTGRHFGAPHGVTPKVR